MVADAGVPRADARETEIHGETAVIMRSYAGVEDSKWKSTRKVTKSKEVAFTTIKTPLKAQRPAKPPALLVHVSEGSNFADTVTSIKSVIDFPALEGEVRRIRNTKDGHALIEFAMNPKSYVAANRLDGAIRFRPELRVGRIEQLGILAKVEMKNVDPTAMKELVLEAVRRAISADAPDRKAEAAGVEVTRLWPLDSGCQMTTLKMTKWLLSRLGPVRVSWTSQWSGRGLGPR